MQLKTSTKKGENMLFFKKFSYNALKVTNYIIYTIIYVYTWLKFGHTHVSLKKMYRVP